MVKNVAWGSHLLTAAVIEGEKRLDIKIISFNSLALQPTFRKVKFYDVKYSFVNFVDFSIFSRKVTEDSTDVADVSGLRTVHVGRVNLHVG